MFAATEKGGRSCATLASDDSLPVNKRASLLVFLLIVCERSVCVSANREGSAVQEPRNVLPGDGRQRVEQSFKLYSHRK